MFCFVNKIDFTYYQLGSTKTSLTFAYTSPPFTEVRNMTQSLSPTFPTGSTGVWIFSLVIYTNNSQNINYGHGLLSVWGSSDIQPSPK